MKLILALAICLTPFLANSQTCIIIYVHPGSITAGADRLYHDKHKRYYDKKIFLHNGIYRALSGADYNHLIHDAAIGASVKNRLLKTVVQRMQQRLQQNDISEAMRQLLHTAGTAQKQRFRNNMTEVAFFKKENGLYKAYRLTISMPGIDKGNAGLHFETDSVVAAKRTEGFLVLGHYAAFDKYEKQVDWSKPVEAIRKLIRLQAALTPDDVSAASDIFSIQH